MGFRELFKTGIVAFGGFTLAETVYKPRYSIIGHWDADHVVVSEDVVIFAPLKPPRRIEDFVNRWYMQIPFNKLRAVCSIGQETLYARALGDRELQEIDISERFHRTSPSRSTVPIRLILVKNITETSVEKEIMLYIDDFDVGDVLKVKRLIDWHAEEFGQDFKGVLLPAYAGTKGHGAKHPKELSDASKHLVEFSAEKGLEIVGTLIHSPNWYPRWLTNLKAKYPSILEFPRTLKVLEDDPRYRDRHKR